MNSAKDPGGPVSFPLLRPLRPQPPHGRPASIGSRSAAGASRPVRAQGLDPNRPVPLVVLLHGAGGASTDIVPLMQGAAEAQKFLVLRRSRRTGPGT
jgi:hypothetical protein